MCRLAVSPQYGLGACKWQKRAVDQLRPERRNVLQAHLIDAAPNGLVESPLAKSDAVGRQRAENRVAIQRTVNTVKEQLREVAAHRGQVQRRTVRRVEELAHSEVNTTAELGLVGRVRPRPQQEDERAFHVTTTERQDTVPKPGVQFGRLVKSRLKGLPVLRVGPEFLEVACGLG